MYQGKAYPYPEIVTGDEWHVLETTEQDSQPRTDNLNKQMYVPMDRECDDRGVNHSRMIRRHELGHAKWSPKTMGKLMRGTRADCIHALEEVRINYLLGLTAQLHVDEFIQCKDLVERRIFTMIEKASIADIILYIIASYSTETVPGAKYVNDSEQYKFTIDRFNSVQGDERISDLRKAEISFAVSTARRFVRFITNHRYNQLPAYRKVQKYAEKLSKIINEFIDKPKEEDVFKPKPQAGGQSQNNPENEDGESEDGESEDTSNELTDTVKKLEQRMRQNLIEDMAYHSSNGVGQWGNMEIHQPPLTVNLQGRLKNSRQYRSADFGYNPKYINRYCIDKKIFKQKQNVKGGTILIDASGSMCFDGKDILDIMQLLPAVNIAMYNGWGNTGHLHVIAKNGMRVSEKYMHENSGAGNVVDGPALQWLASMPARRIWVSDMKVFGIGRHSNGFNLLRECYDICTKNKIINLRDMEEVKEHALKLNTVL